MERLAYNTRIENLRRKANKAWQPALEYPLPDTKIEEMTFSLD